MDFSSFSPFVQGYILTVVAIIGLVIGSFLNVVGLRLLSGESIVFPGSKCPKCSTPLAWYDNIPVLGYILLWGRCRYCKEHISIQYPIVEASTSILFLSIFLQSGFSLKTIFLMILASLLIVITITDLKEKVIFDVTSYPLIPLGLIYNFFDIGQTGSATVKIPLEGIGYTLPLKEIFISAIIGAIVGALFFEIISRVGLLLVGQYAFGSGDSIIAAVLGAWFGWKMLLLIIILSFIFQLIPGIPAVLFNMYKDKDYKSIAFFGVLLFSVAVPYIGQWLGLNKTLFGVLLILLVALAFAMTGIIVILKRAKERQSFTVMPFGPALVFGGFVVMFWGPQLLSWYLSHYRI